MPKLKTVQFKPQSKSRHFDMEHEPISADIHVSASGEFYSNVPEFLSVVIKYQHINQRGRAKDRIQVFASTMNALIEIIQTAINDYFEPEITEEPVILYNIESHVSFAEDESGVIYPNAGFPGASWNKDKSLKHGDHHASNVARGGYSLTVGAKAMVKSTCRYGDQVKVRYTGRYEGAEQDSPAQLLNSWCSFTLPDKAKEIPYSDEAALFFHSMMMSMAMLCRKVQNATFDQDDLKILIASGQHLLLPGKVQQLNGETQ